MLRCSLGAKPKSSPVVSPCFVASLGSILGDRTSISSLQQIGYH
jgi:hypothetical protein